MKTKPNVQAKTLTMWCNGNGTPLIETLADNKHKVLAYSCSDADLRDLRDACDAALANSTAVPE